jgi:hypothetical protein
MMAIKHHCGTINHRLSKFHYCQVPTLMCLHLSLCLLIPNYNFSLKYKSSSCASTVAAYCC